MTSSADHPVAIRQGKVWGPSRQPGQEQVEMGPETGLETRLLGAGRSRWSGQLFKAYDCSEGHDTA